jgi:GT2 family glycosyltransferase
MRRQLDCIVATVFEGNIPLVSANFRNQHPGFYFLAMYKKSLIEAMNGWDEDFMAGVGYDDNDFGERWVRSGYSYEISPDIVAEHQHHDRNDQSGMLTNASLLNRNREHNVTRCKNGLVKE